MLLLIIVLSGQSWEGEGEEMKYRLLKILNRGK